MPLIFSPKICRMEARWSLKTSPTMITSRDSNKWLFGIVHARKGPNVQVTILFSSIEMVDLVTLELKGRGRNRRLLVKLMRGEGRDRKLTPFEIGFLTVHVNSEIGSRVHSTKNYESGKPIFHSKSISYSLKYTMRGIQLCQVGIFTQMLQSWIKTLYRCYFWECGIVQIYYSD